MGRLRATSAACPAALVFLLVALQGLQCSAISRQLTQYENPYGPDDSEATPPPASPPSPPANTSASLPPACSKSTLLNGCVFDGGAGVEVHYELIGSSSIRFAIRAETTGYVAISVTEPDQGSMAPADAVIGWFTPTGGASVKAYRIDGYTTPALDTSVTLTNTSATEEQGVTTVYFTRELSAGRYPIDITKATFNVAHCSADVLEQHDDKATFSANLQTGEGPSPSSPPVATPPSTATPSTSQTTTAASSCIAPAVASSLVPGGCAVDGGAGVTVHYKLLGSPPDSVTIGLEAATTGYVAMGFTDGRQAMWPADAVIGWTGTSGTSVKAYRLSAYTTSGVAPDDTVPLTDTSATESGGKTTVIFTRPLNAGQFPINPSLMTYNVARGRGDTLAQHVEATSGSISLESGTVSQMGTSPKDKFWVTHGILMIIAWALLVPHAVGFARFKGKWGEIFKKDAMWFHAHRLLQLLALIAHAVAIIVAKSKFGEYKEDNPLHLHAAIAWIVTGLIGVQWIVALFFRPDKTAPKRKTWNIAHFSMGRVMVVLALVNIGIGIYLYQRKSGDLLLSTGAWIAIFAVMLATGVAHFVLLALRRAPAEASFVATNPVKDPAVPGPNSTV